jgi:hypothetical protein
MAHRFSQSYSTPETCCIRCKLPPDHRVHHGDIWEIRQLPFGARHWFAHHPEHRMSIHKTWAAAMARVCEDLREKQNV